METIKKGSDLKLHLKLTDKLGIPFRVADTDEFVISIYTCCCDNDIQGSYKNGEYTNIVPKERIDTLYINASDLEKLSSGVLKYTYQMRFADENFDDGYFDKVVTGTTNLYLK